MVKRNDGPLPMERRMEVFQAVVDEQDKGIDTVRARQRVARVFGVSESAVRRIEEEGLREEWPPL
jgi:hypothetical protein